MKIIKRNFINKRGYSLAELLAALIISSMIIIAVFGIYGRLNKVSASVTGRLEKEQMPREVLQLICEDLERILTDGRDTRISFRNKTDRSGTHSARLEIIKSIYDKDNNAQTFEQIIWQCSYDPDSSDKTMVLYRRHNGLALEDKLLDELKPVSEKQLFIPVCSGVTFFSIENGAFDSGNPVTTPDGKAIVNDNWSTAVLPQNIIATISFAEPVEVSPGLWQVPDSEKTTRVIALDRTRKITFKIETKDINSIDMNQPSFKLKSMKDSNQSSLDTNLFQDFNSAGRNAGK